MTKLSIVIPCYYNEANIADTYQVFKEDVFLHLGDTEYELIFVDDGSGDRTLEELFKVQSIDSHVRIVKLSRNFGEFRAIVAGMSVATGDCVAVTSADLQDPPKLILPMFESWKKGNKVNLAVRTDRKENWFKNFLANTYYRWMRKLVNKNYPKEGFDFFLIDQCVYQEIVRMQEKNSSLYMQIIWLGYKPTEIGYVREKREKGKSMWSYKKRFAYFVDSFVVFSHQPIRLISFIGFLFSIVGLILAIYFIVDWFISQQPPGWTSLIVVILLVSGFQMIMLGIIGEYVWRNLDESRKRPLYVIDKVIEAHPHK